MPARTAGGSPAELIEVAARWDVRSEMLAELVKELDRTFAGLSWFGPAPERIRAEWASRRMELWRAAEFLRDASKSAKDMAAALDSLER